MSVTLFYRNDIVDAVLTAMVRRFADLSVPTKNAKRLHSLEKINTRYQIPLATDDLRACLKTDESAAKA